ncbi:MAG: SRPBCC family protein [Bdellovibrionota bacterium]
MGHLKTSRLIPAPIGEVYRHVVNPEHLPQWLTPAIEVEFPETLTVLRERSEFSVRFRRFNQTVDAVFRVEEMKPRERVTYRQVSGFFRLWRHTQVLRAHDERTTLLMDLVDFKMPYGIFGTLADDLFASRDLERILKQRLVRIEERFSGPG